MGSILAWISQLKSYYCNANSLHWSLKCIHLTWHNRTRISGGWKYILKLKLEKLRILFCVQHQNMVASTLIIVARNFLHAVDSME